ncbi:MAG: hypothetical protein E7262_00010 [Lachnospiraceae bacterium]|nr:hypothetical protein [Lachnospiraceae bacterium]
MFSKARKHFNSIVLFMIIYIILVLFVFIGETMFKKDVQKDLESNINTQTKNTKNMVNEMINEASKNILLFEKTLVEKATSTTYVVMGDVFDEVKERNSVFELKNILLYSKESEYYNYENQGIDDTFNINDLSWVGEIEEYYDTKISYFYDEDLGENYIVVSEKIMSNDMVVAMCYSAEDISANVFLGTKGNGYVMNSEGKIVLAKDTLLIGKDGFTEDKVLKADNSIYSRAKGNTVAAKVNKNEYYVTVEDIVSDYAFVSILPNEEALEGVKGWYYKSIILTILMSVVVALGFLQAFVATDKINGVVDSKCTLLERIADEVKTQLALIGENTKYIVFESTNEKFISKANNITDVTKTIEFILDSVTTYSGMFKKDFQNEKGEYTAYELMEEVQSIVSCNAKKCNIYLNVNIESDERLKFYGDRKQITAAIVNLLNLSIGKTKQGGVDVVVSCDEIFADKTKFNINVKDSSAGMEDDEVAELQEKINSKKKKLNVAETGLGFEMIKMVVNNLNGKFDIKSTRNVGTEYTLKIPVVALFNTDEDFIRQQREKKEKVQDQELNNSFWSGVEATTPASSDDGLSLSDMGNDNGLTLSDMGNDNSGLSLSDMGETPVKQDNSYMNSVSQQQMPNQVDTQRQMQAQMEAQRQMQMQGQMEAQRQMQMQAQMEAQRQRQMQMQGQMDAQAQMQMQAQMEAQRQMQMQGQMDAQAQMQMQAQMDAQAQMQMQGQMDMQSQMDMQNQMDMQGQMDVQSQMDMQTQMSIQEQNDIQMQSDMDQGLDIQDDFQTQSTSDNDSLANEINVEESNPESIMEEKEKSLDSISMDEMNKKYIEMISASKIRGKDEAVKDSKVDESKEENNTQSPYFQADTINSMRLNTLYVDNETENEVEEDEATKAKKDKMYIYLQEDAINVDDGYENCSKDVNEYEKVLKEFYNYSHKNVRNIIGLWNQKKFEEYYIEITKITTSALNIGANNLYNMLCEQQKNYNIGDMKAVADNVKTIFDEWKKVLLYIAEYFKN